MFARAGEGDGAGAAAVEHQDAAHEVGGVEAGDGEGEDVVEDGGGAEVDEGEETGEDCGHADGVERYGAAGFYLILSLVGRMRDCRYVMLLLLWWSVLY